MSIENIVARFRALDIAAYPHRHDGKTGLLLIAGRERDAEGDIPFTGVNITTGDLDNPGKKCVAGNWHCWSLHYAEQLLDQVEMVCQALQHAEEL